MTARTDWRMATAEEHAAAIQALHTGTLPDDFVLPSAGGHVVPDAVSHALLQRQVTPAWLRPTPAPRPRRGLCQRIDLWLYVRVWRLRYRLADAIAGGER